MITKFFLFFIVHIKYNKKHWWNFSYKKFKVLGSNDYIKYNEITKSILMDSFFTLTFRRYILLKDFRNRSVSLVFPTDTLDRLRKNKIKIKISYVFENDDIIYTLYVPKKSFSKVKLMGIFDNE